MEKIIVVLLMVMIMVEPLESVKAISDEDLISMECLNVPESVFINTLKNSMDGVIKVASIVAKFAGVFGDFRVSNAISDCLDLLQLSSDELGWTLYASQYAVTGARFIARDITFQNTAGPEKHQAVAFRSDSDLSALYRCAFRGYQDTLYAHANRQFFRECTITGTVDFIFGDAVAIFQNCLIQSRKGLSNQKNTITAQGRKDPGENTGFSLQFCNITGDSSLNTAITNTTNTTTTYTYLGRPWKAYSRTIIMQSYISGVIRPAGWLEWNGDLHLDTLFYAEYMNYGPGASLSARVKWPGYNIFNTSAQALNYTVAQFIKGDMWLPTTGIRFASGLSAL